MVPVLSHTLVASDTRAPRRRLVVLHGAFGAGHNWRTVARNLVRQRPDWSVILPDLRLHGSSQGFLPPHTLRAAASDIATLTQALGTHADALLGHSLGGKVALRYSADYPAGLEQLWVVDATPAPEPHTGSAWQMLRTVRALPREFESRADAAAALVRGGFTPVVAQWMTANLEQVGGRYRWRLDFNAIEELLDDASAADLWSMVADPTRATTLHFIKATDSDILSPKALQRLRTTSTAGGMSIHELVGGHWIQADNPDGVIRLLSEHLPRDAAGA
ncbi:MAG TPA: alpha/beta hydrolase [bacterium]|nr:alpha/beta hydrolase [bacterium]